MLLSRKTGVQSGTEAASQLSRNDSVGSSERDLRGFISQTPVMQAVVTNAMYMCMVMIVTNTNSCN